MEEIIREFSLDGWELCISMVAVLIGIVCFGFICSRVISGMKSSGKKNLDYVVVLGAHVKGDVPSKALELRLKAALKYARENEDTTLILSGGQGFGEDITEAKCMENYLTAHGISGSGWCWKKIHKHERKI